MNSVIPPTDNTVVLITLNTSENRSVSPMTPSPSREIRGIRLFRAISRKLARRSNEDLNTDVDSRSSSSDSCSSTKKEHLSGDSGFRSVSPNHSSSSSEAGSDLQVRPRHHHSTSADSIRRVFQNLNLNSRSQSCTNAKETKRKNSKKSTPKRILRSPVTYTYVKGLSGLPTQRIPKNQSRMYMNNPCGCSIQYMAGLNR
ncbi:uncharacterized protein LOC123014721 [Tribolium madens]|uniref:uncharacterized protein LOC123014721 n=1 Tax=Tribolium madens TaxID=41895 RepID=UPI001CF739C4|nr:uncharacterized protein LOC123014721 [Tribolium madens]